jgi:diaminopimelate epimerase
MGNPHAVIFVDDSDKFPVKEVGSKIEIHSLFPRRTNVEFVSIRGKNHLYQRTWERGAGETLACGTGATACALFLAFRNELTQGTVVVNAKGGKLAVRFVRNESGFEQIWLLGPASNVFNGEITLL